MQRTAIREPLPAARDVPGFAEPVIGRAFARPVGSTLATGRSVAVAVLAILAVVADMLDGDHVLVLGGIEHDDALGRAAGDHAARQCPL